LRLARQQQEEIEREEAELEADDDDETPSAVRPLEASFRDMEELEDEDDEDDDENVSLASDADGEEFNDPDYEQLDILPEDQALLERHDEEEEQALADEDAGRPRTKTLADLIMAKIEASEASSGETAQYLTEDDSRLLPPGINPKIIEVYTKVGDLLSRYKSGPLPKAFKIIPSLPAWEDVLYITRPETWTPHATLAATRIFVSNFKPAQCERFYRLIFLDKIRDEIHENKKVSYHTYEAIKKSLYKPAAFFKGILFPLCDVVA